MSKPSLYFPHLNLLRAFAALSVIIYHVKELLPWQGFPIQPSAILWIHTGWMGVDLFFVLSGFVITLSALQLYANSATVKEARGVFIRRRLARIVPLYMLTMLSFLGAALLFKPEIWDSSAKILYHLLTHLFFLHNLFINTHGSLNGPNWSVAAEMQFYLLVFLLMPWIARARVWQVLLAGIAIAWGLRALVFFWAQAHDWELFPRFVYTTQMPAMLDEFAFGICLAKLVTTSPDAWRLEWNQLSRSKKFWVVLGAFSTCFSLSQWLYWQDAEFWHNGASVIFWRTLLGLSFALLIALMVLLPAGAWTRNVFYRMCWYLGEISYGLYLWHLPSIEFGKRLGLTDPFAFLGFVVGSTILLAALSWHFVETPILKRAKSWHSGWLPRSQPAIA